MADFRSFEADIEAQILSVWPEVSAIYFESGANVERWKGFTLPYAVVIIRGYPRAPGFPITCDVRRPLVEILYIDQGRETTAALEGKVALLSARFWPHSPLTAGQTIGIEVEQWDDSLEVNALFRSANRHQRAGLVAVRCLAGITNQ